MDNINLQNLIADNQISSTWTQKSKYAPHQLNVGIKHAKQKKKKYCSFIIISLNGYPNIHPQTPHHYQMTDYHLASTQPPKKKGRQEEQHANNR